MSLRILRIAAVCLAIAPLCAWVCFAGPLDPPAGPVAPTYKTLDQVRPGIPIDAIPYLITVPGSHHRGTRRDC